jgi:alkanesulfonate monooxygenase SsuD/methylene tetrahydromethanopterin reductase-like flavin-dependent oxidoreductase (luciferase family)
MWKDRLMTAMDFGVVIHPTPRGGTLPDMHRANEQLLAAATAHDLSCWVIDHFQFDDQPILECFAFLAYHAGRAPGPRWGNLVLGQGYRNPALTAKIAASLQFLTGGRFILGIGAGWKEDEYRSYGYPFPPARVRIEQLDEACQIIKALWRGGPATVTGQHYQIEDAYCVPTNDPPPVLMIGGGGEQRTLRVVAERADWWNCDYYTADDYARKLAILHQHCRVIGRDPASIVPTCYMGISLSNNPNKLIRRPPVQGRPDMFVISGNAEKVTAQIEAFARVGVRHMQLNFLGFPDIAEGLGLFLSDVRPRFERANT